MFAIVGGHAGIGGDQQMSTIYQMIQGIYP